MYAQAVTIGRPSADFCPIHLPTLLTATEIRMPVSASWHYLALSRIHALVRTGAAYEGVGDLRIEPATAAYARRVLDLLRDQLDNEILPSPTISAISGGGIGMFWRAGTKEVEAIVYPDSTASFLALKDDAIQGEDEFVGDGVTSLRDALKHMLQG